MGRGDRTQALRQEEDIMKAFVTGGAGFIASHVVDRLLGRGDHVTIYDNFSTGQERFIQHHLKNPAVTIVRADVLDAAKLEAAMAGHDIVFHFQANADVRGGIRNTRVDLDQNTIATWNVLEAMRKHGIKTIVFASSAAVYGEPIGFPTKETEPLVQTSLYGASKLACEAMLEAYAEYYGIRCLIFRFVSWIGERYTHGVIFDFVTKLLADPRHLEILGDGKQQKSYLEVRDGIEGIFAALDRSTGKKEVFNLGHDEQVDVITVAGIVAEEMGLNDVQYTFTGGARGWIGDSPFVHLDTGKMKKLGWKPKTSIEQGIRQTVRYLLENKESLTARKKKDSQH